MKIDVCIVTRKTEHPMDEDMGLEHIPINEIIIDRSKPIGIARMNCIKLVKTKIFAFIDDDITVTENWYKGLMPFMEDKQVGAVWGTITNKGLGICDRAYGAVIPFGELKKKDRFNTNNSLIRTEVVRDWKPTIGLNCYEDLDLGRHIMNKGYKILIIPCDTIHRKSYINLAKSAYWAGSTWYESYKPSKFKHVKQYMRRIISPFFQIFTRGLLSCFIVAYRNGFFLIGLIISDIKRLIKK